MQMKLAWQPMRYPINKIDIMFYLSQL